MLHKYTAIKDVGHSVIKLREDGIIEIDCRNNYEYSVNDVKENWAIIKELAKGKKILVFNNMPEFTTASKETREFVAKGEHKDFIAAEAFVIQSLAQKILGNFYLKINKPVVPAKIFTNKENAVQWLSTFKQKNISI
jgi:hypothetical protein